MGNTVLRPTDPSDIEETNQFGYVEENKNDQYDYDNQSNYDEDEDDFGGNTFTSQREISHYQFPHQNEYRNQGSK